MFNIFSILTVCFLLIGCSTNYGKEYTISKYMDMRDIREVTKNQRATVIQQKGYYLVQVDKEKKPEVITEKEKPTDVCKSPGCQDAQIKGSEEEGSNKVIVPDGGIFNIATGKQVLALSEMLYATNNNIVGILDENQNKVEKNLKELNNTTRDIRTQQDLVLQKTQSAINESSLSVQKRIDSGINTLRTVLTDIDNKISRPESWVKEITLFFDENKSTLNKEEIKRLVDFISNHISDKKKGERVYIALLGSSSTKKNEYLTYSLANDRAKLVYNLLNKYMVNHDYIIAKSYGISDKKALESKDSQNRKFDNVLIIFTNNSKMLEDLPHAADIPVDRKSVVKQDAFNELKDIDLSDLPEEDRKKIIRAKELSEKGTQFHTTKKNILPVDKDKKGDTKTDTSKKQETSSKQQDFGEKQLPDIQNKTNVSPLEKKVDINQMIRERMGRMESDKKQTQPSKEGSSQFGIIPVEPQKK